MNLNSSVVSQDVVDARLQSIRSLYGGYPSPIASDKMVCIQIVNDMSQPKEYRDLAQQWLDEDKPTYQAKGSRHYRRVRKDARERQQRRRINKYEASRWMKQKIKLRRRGIDFQVSLVLFGNLLIWWYSHKKWREHRIRLRGTGDVWTDDNTALFAGSELVASPLSSLWEHFTTITPAEEFTSNTYSSPISQLRQLAINKPVKRIKIKRRKRQPCL